jgi:O-antigen biosynthesis protein
VEHTSTDGFVVAHPPTVRVVEPERQFRPREAEPSKDRSDRRSIRVQALGKHLSLGGDHFVVRGTTYGSFRSRQDGQPFPEPDIVRSDFRSMAAIGLNTVRIYQTPSIDVLDAAAEHDLRLIVGLSCADWRMEPVPGRAARSRIRDAGLRAVDEAMQLCAGRPEVLAISVGNEVPADLVRVHGIGSVKSTLEELVEAVHRADPGVLATYTNYPTTEYLEVGGTDIDTFNVFLEDHSALQRYVRHLQVVSGTKPLILTELGLASEVHGLDEQALSLEQQLCIVDKAGCAGATVFSWTDEWSVAEESVEGWGFGVTTADRQPKPAFDAVGAWASRGVKDLRDEWPRLSVVVCAYNEERTMEACLASLEQCDYPDLEVIVCDDGSTDRTLEIARGFPFRILELEHGGLSRARNAGIEAATGEYVAFLDADAACHSQWPWHLVLSFDAPDVAASGGPNLPVPGADLVERAVALSPGAPTEVLLTDDRAEHVAGCNMAFRRDAIRAIGSFDPAYTAAGDDVDVCWKLLDSGGPIAFSPAAQVFHHRRGTIRGYLRQQRGYGRAEKLLSGAHPHRFNALGQARWAGFIYGSVGMLPKLLRPVVYHGHRGEAPFQAISARRSERAAAWASALMPFSAPLAAIGLLLALWSSWFLLIPALIVASVAVYALAVGISVTPARGEPRPLLLRSTVSLLHVLQPWVRTWGRLRGQRNQVPPQPPAWNGDRSNWLRDLERELHSKRVRVHSGGPDHAWDLAASVGPFLVCRITTGVAWNWVPHVSTRCRARRALVGAVVVSALLLPLLPWLGVGVLSVIAIGSTYEWVRLRLAVRSAIASTCEPPP